MTKIRVRWLFCIEIFQVNIAPFLVCCPSEIKFDRRFLQIANGNFSIDVRTGVALQGTKKLVHWTKIVLLQIQKIGLLFWPRLQPIHYQKFFEGLIISKMI